MHRSNIIYIGSWNNLKILTGNKIHHNSKNSLNNDRLIWKKKDTSCFVTMTIPGSYPGITTDNLTNSIEIDCFNKGSQQGNEWCALFLTVHCWTPFELCQDLNNGDRALALAESMGLEQCFRDEGFFVCVFASFCFCKKPHFNHLDCLLVLIISGDLRKLIEYQKEIFATNVF